MKKKFTKLPLGFALLFVGILLFIGHTKGGSEENNYTFANEPVQIEGLSNPGEEEKLPVKIIIPTLSINLDVKKANVVNGFWEVFSDLAAWGTGSGLPGKPGNQVIFAHAREGLFLPLKNVRVGMSIYILTDDNWYGYNVKEIKEVYPNQTEVISPTNDETLTLYTCSGFQDSKRLIVIAKRN